MIIFINDKMSFNNIGDEKITGKMKPFTSNEPITVRSLYSVTHGCYICQCYNCHLLTLKSFTPANVKDGGSDSES